MILKSLMIKSMSKAELSELKESLLRQYDSYKAKGLKLDMSRGKPAADQLDTAMGLLDVLTSESDMKNEAGVDCRNYGGIELY